MIFPLTGEGPTCGRSLLILVEIFKNAVDITITIKIP